MLVFEVYGLVHACFMILLIWRIWKGFCGFAIVHSQLAHHIWNLIILLCVSNLMINASIFVAIKSMDSNVTMKAPTGIEMMFF